MWSSENKVKDERKQKQILQDQVKDERKQKVIFQNQSNELKDKMIHLRNQFTQVQALVAKQIASLQEQIKTLEAENKRLKSNPGAHA